MNNNEIPSLVAEASEYEEDDILTFFWEVTKTTNPA